MLMLSSTRVLQRFSRNIRKPLRSGKVNTSEDQLSSRDMQEYEQTFAPLSRTEEQPPTNRLVKEIQKELIYSGEDKHPTKLVNRIQKNAVWGLGGQLLNFSRRLNKEGVVGTVESIKEYLLTQQTKNIYVHDFGPVMPNIQRWAIIASAYSNRHCYKVATDLKNALNERKKREEYPAKMVGRKDDEWVLVDFNDISIHVMTEQERADADLQWKWNNPVSEEVIEKYERLANHKSRGFFEPFDD